MIEFSALADTLTQCTGDELQKKGGFVSCVTTEAVARFIVNAEYNELPAEVISTAKRGVLDWLGVTIAGHRRSRR